MFGMGKVKSKDLLLGLQFARMRLIEAAAEHKVTAQNLSQAADMLGALADNGALLPAKDRAAMIANMKGEMRSYLAFMNKRIADYEAQQAEVATEIQKRKAERLLREGGEPDGTEQPGSPEPPAEDAPGPSGSDHSPGEARDLRVVRPGDSPAP